MTLSPKALIEATGAQFVAGTAIAIVEGKHVAVARNTADGLMLTADGLLLANSLHPLDRDASSEPGGSRPGKRAKTKAAPEPAPEPEPEPEPIDFDLGLDDDVATDEQFD